MLVSFKIKNFKSYKDLKKFSMKTTKLKNLQDTNTFTINDNISLLKSAVIYGANASGKSSLVEAMNEFRNIIENSFDKKTIKRYKGKPFLLNTDTEKKETLFEIEFIIDKTIYRYGFEIAINATILNEWFYQKKLRPHAREVLLFERNNQKISLGNSFKEGKVLDNHFKNRESTLFLSGILQFEGEISKKVKVWLDKFNIVSSIRSYEFEDYSLVKLENNSFKKKIINFIKKLDVGIYSIDNKNITFDELKKDIDIEKLKLLSDDIISTLEKEGLSKIETIHMQYNKDNSFNKLSSFDLEFESDGTKKLLALTAPIIETLQNGEILIIDELDNSLHTELLKAIVMLFNSKESNPNNAQLIFTTHDTNLLNQKFFRRDQIWFTEKDIYGATDLYSLVEYGKGKTRDDLELAKNYLKGKFGAIPHIALDYEVQ